ncbi:MAG TPA: AsmA family protein [Terriglobia bacterium]|nr:AsmA family protein [Terriglobia bacterium]
MSRRTKILLGLVIAIVVVLIGLVVVVPLLFNIDNYRPQATAYIQQQTGKPTTIGHMALTVFPSVSIRLDDFTLGNPPGFPQGNFVKVRRVSAVVDAGALWNRQVVIKSLELDDPVINLLSDVRGQWNFENAPKTTTRDSKPEEKPLFTLGVIDKVRVSGGQLAAANLLASGGSGPTYFEGRGMSIDLNQVDLSAFTQSASFRAPDYPGGLLTSVAYAATPEAPPVAQGTLRADLLRFGTLSATTVKSKVRLFPKQVFFDDLNFNCYDGHATGNLGFNFAGQNPGYTTQAQLKGVNVAKLLEAFPDGRGRMTGTLDGAIKLAGAVTHSPDPLAGMRGAGQMDIRNGQLPSLQLNKNLMMLARVAKLGPAAGDPSSFSSIAADLNIANDRITSNKVSIVGNGVNVNAAGSMGMAGAGELDYQGIASLAAGQNAVSDLIGGLSGAKIENGKLTFPFGLLGTLENPKFSLKGATAAGRLGAVEGLLRGQQPGQSTAQPGQTPADVVQGITGLFKKKKQSTQQQKPK